MLQKSITYRHTHRHTAVGVESLSGLKTKDAKDEMIIRVEKSDEAFCKQNMTSLSVPEVFDTMRHI